MPTPFFTPANLLKSGWVTIGNDVVELDATKRVLIGLNSTDITGGSLLVKTFFGVCSAETNASNFFISIFGGVVSLVSAKQGVGTLLPLAINVGSANRIFVDVTGNIGFHTDTPGYITHVKSGADGVAFAVERSTGSLFTVDVSTTLTKIGNTSNHPLSIIVNSTNSIYIDAAGNVGINNTAPTKKLDITGDINVAGNSHFSQITTAGSPANSYTGTGINAVSNFINALGGTFTISLAQVSGVTDNFIGTTTLTDWSLIANNSPVISIFASTGRVQVNQSIAQGYNFYVNGSSRITGGIISDSDVIFNTNGFVAQTLVVGSTSAADASAILEIDSTTQGFLPPRMTTAQRNAISSPHTGLLIYNSSTNKLNVYTGAWEQVTSA